MKKLTLLLALLVLVLSALSALAEQDNLGNPMPDFSFVNTEGETITLSEVLKEKDLVHISFSVRRKASTKQNKKKKTPVNQRLAQDSPLHSMCLGWPRRSLRLICSLLPPLSVQNEASTMGNASSQIGSDGPASGKDVS